jgi:hypothetical protein
MSKWKPVLDQKTNDTIRKLININFKHGDSNEPFDPTPAQADIFAAVVYDLPIFQRLVIMGYSQFGKSEIVGMALLWKAAPCVNGDKSVKIPIITPSGEKSQIIMDYILTHMRDQKMFSYGLLNVEAIDKLRVSTRKDKLVWSNNSEIRTLSANVTRREAKSSGLMGFGGDIIVVDEATDIPDSNFAKVLRMLAGNAEGSKLIKIFNPTEKNHAYKSYLDSRYLNIVIDWEDGIKQGRLTVDLVKEFFDSMPSQDFKVLYECEFPETSDKYLFTVEQLEAVSHQIISEAPDKKSFAGLDTAWKGNDDIILTILNGKNFILQKSYRPESWDHETSHLLAQAILAECKVNNVKVLCVDSTGNGALLYDALSKENFENRYNDFKIKVIGINFAERPTEERLESEEVIAMRSLNKRAEMFMDFRKAVLDQSIYIPKNFNVISELAQIEYDFQNGKYKIEPKDIISKRIGHSPDKSDSLVLAYHAKVLNKYYGPFENMQYVY